MLRTLFTILPITVNDPSLSVIDWADTAPLVDYEVTAFDHWIFDNGPASLTGLKEGTVLTPQTTAPTYGADSIIISSDYQKGLLSTKADAAELTSIVVLKRPAQVTSGVHLLYGNMSATGFDGSCAFNGATDTLFGRVKPSSASASRALTNPAIGSYIFTALSEKVGIDTILYVGGYAIATTPNAAKTLSAVNQGLGNLAYSTGLSAKTMEIAEYILFDTALTEAQLNAVYARSKARLLKRGITVY